MNGHRIRAREVFELLSEKIDGELSSADERELSDHLQTCEGCRRMERALARADGALRISRPMPAAAAQRESLARVRAEAKRGFAFAGLFRGAAVIGVAMTVVLLAIAVPRLQAANTGIPIRETVVSRTESTSIGPVEITVEQGSASARRGQNIGVSVNAEVRLASPALDGSAEIRVREPGDAYGILARNPNLSGVTLLRLEGGFPSLDGDHVYDVWMHVELSDTTIDTQPIRIEVQSVPGGERARVP